MDTLDLDINMRVNGEDVQARMHRARRWSISCATISA
jgi:hypothetical protein